MKHDGEGVPPKRWTRGEKRFATFLAVVVALVLAALIALVLIWNWAAENTATAGPLS